MNPCLAVAIGCFVLACVPAIIFAANLRSFTRLPRHAVATVGPLPPVSVLIPARNEAQSISAAVNSVLATRGIVFELIVLDDDSTDDTFTIVQAIAENDDRVRIIRAPTMPAGWCGKQHACQILAGHARNDTLLWIDADVRLSSDAVACMAMELARNPAPLISGFPLELTKTWLEVLLIPLIHFILLGFLPLKLMRRSIRPALGAGCGQLFVARRKDYIQAGGHGAIRASLHDGIALPRAFRKADKQTDLFDASDLAQCRMYDSAAAVWRGLLKNAGEGIATPGGVLPWTALLAGGQILPAILTMYLITSHRIRSFAMVLAISACLLGIIVRLISARRFYARRSGSAKYVSAVVHPLGVLLFLLIQWQSLLLRIAGRRPKWKGRSY